jgi:hypothetical protein
MPSTPREWDMARLTPCVTFQRSNDAKCHSSEPRDAANRRICVGMCFVSLWHPTCFVLSEFAASLRRKRKFRPSC